MHKNSDMHNAKTVHIARQVVFGKNKYVDKYFQSHNTSNIYLIVVHVEQKMCLSLNNRNNFLLFLEIYLSPQQRTLTDPGQFRNLSICLPLFQ